MVSEVLHEAPREPLTPLQRAVYGKLDELRVPFSRVETDRGVSIDDCREVDGALGVSTVKTLLLCNRQKTRFYLLVMPGDKPFVTRDFGAALGVSRVSFAPAEMLGELLGTVVGGASPLAVVSAPAHIRVVFDREALATETFGCNDGTPHNYLRLATDDVRRYLESCGRPCELVDL